MYIATPNPATLPHLSGECCSLCVQEIIGQGRLTVWHNGPLLKDATSIYFSRVLDSSIDANAQSRVELYHLNHQHSGLPHTPSIQRSALEGGMKCLQSVWKVPWFLHFPFSPFDISMHGAVWLHGACTVHCELQTSAADGCY